MKIKGIRIDGYGCFSLWKQDDLGFGLTVFFGPNEAGKSTLLQFLREMLFAPWSHKGSRLSNPPLRGGPHGGGLILDGPGGLWRLEKHLRGGKPSISLLSPENRQAQEEELKNLLGKSDYQLFRSVFTFDLADLVQLEHLSRGELRAQLFSAALAGAGSGAPAALRRLQEQAENLHRPRGESVLSRLLEEHHALVQRKTRAFQESSKYPALLAEERQLAQEEALLETERRQLLNEDQHLARLIQFRGFADEINRLETEAGRYRADDRLRDAAPAVARLQQELAELTSMEAPQGEAARERDALEQKIAEDRRRLGPGWNEQALRLLSTGLNTEQQLASLEKRMVAADQEKTVAAAALEQSERTVEEAQQRLAAREERLRDLGPEPLSSEELRDQAASLNALREHWRARQSAMHILEERRARLSEVRTRNQERDTLAARHQLGPLFLLLTLAAGAAGVWSWTLRHWAEAGFFGAIFLVLGWMAWHFLRRTPEPVTSRDLALAEQQYQSASQNLKSSVEAEHSGASRFELELPLTPESLAQVETRIKSEEDRRRAWDGLVQGIEDVQSDLAGAVRTRDQARSRFEQATQEGKSAADCWKEWCQSQGLPLDLTPSGARALLHTIARLQDNMSRLMELRQRHEERRQAAALLRDRAAEVFIRAGEPFPTRPEDLSGALRRLSGSIAADQVVRKKLDQLADQRMGTQRALETTFGTGTNQEILQVDAAQGDPDQWVQRRKNIAGHLEELEKKSRALTGDRRALADRIAALAASADLAELALKETSLAQRIQDAYRHWLVLRAAHSLIDRTIEEFQRTHQPAVLQHASWAIDRMTSGRYRQVVTEEGGGFVLLSAAGERKTEEQLSRGTHEQLYLALRVGLALHLAGQGIDLPLVMDDVLVNFDERRQSSAAALIVEIARERQVLFFTCHAGTAALLAPFAAQVTLGPVDADQAGSTGNG